ncbi:hypothetical protein CBR_g21902 [Chara braunii]|uniref:VWFA domain-containing protein n=1 Tax=Chara braunii TaxID=69332 RepID=A0A388L1S5_CHABU|nr:hypothetical protein CBR_g21902 [Chara braunii]|eukprot:GBG76153.1 hypothetical protein CBR_g21902 [Chara braunii]
MAQAAQRNSSFANALSTGQVLQQHIENATASTRGVGGTTSMSVPYQMPPASQVISMKPPVPSGENAAEKVLPSCPTVYAFINDFKLLGNPRWAQDRHEDTQPLGGSHLPPPSVPSLVPLHVNQMNLDVQCHISTAFVTVEGEWELDFVVKGLRCDCVLAVPMSHHGTMTQIEIDMGEGRMYTTLVIPKDEAASYGAGGSVNAGLEEVGSYNPELFRLTVGQVFGGSKLSVRVSWFQPLLFANGFYNVHIPFIIPNAQLARARNKHVVGKIGCTINVGSGGPVVTGAFNHMMRERKRGEGRVELEWDSHSMHDWRNVDFVGSYQVWSQGILPALIVQDSQPGDLDGRGTFCLSLSPPDPRSVTLFMRSVVFLLDRSGSMYGRPVEDARHSLKLALDLLKPEDKFSVIAFDHEQMAFSPALESAHPAKVQMAKDWIDSTCQARGGTDILAPLRQAIAMLDSAVGGVPYVFLITDGAVSDEREICKEMHSVASARGGSAPRISTFGIGHYCNYFFLRMLAVIGRGIADAAFTQDKVKEQMERLLLAASTPLLTNLQLSIPDLPHGCEIYPFPVPDLFCGNPLVISGKFHGTFPPFVEVVGSNPDGSQWSSKVTSNRVPQIPLNRVFVKQQMDLLTARAWLHDDSKLRAQVVDISVKEGVPCEHTVMVGFETTPEKHQELKADLKAGKQANPKKYAVTKYAAIAVVAGLAIGFGSVMLTMNNAPVLDGLSALGDVGTGFGGDGVGCCDFGGCDGCVDCGECGVSGGCDGCGDCGDILDPIGQCCTSFGDCLDLLSALG